MPRLFLICLVLAVAPFRLWAHEFWLDPVKPMVTQAERVQVRIFIGSDFAGDEVGNFPSMQERVDLFVGGVPEPVKGRVGDLPAFDFQPQATGLHVLRYQSKPNVLTYDSYDKYLRFLAEAEREDLAAVHDARGLSREGISEVYFRYAKGLIAVGDGAGADVATGMPFELVATENPYQREGDAVTFTLLLAGEPLPDAALHIWHRKADGTISSFRMRTDAAGLVEVPAQESGFYLINAIHITPAPEGLKLAKPVSWQSQWASITYQIQ